MWWQYLIVAIVVGGCVAFLLRGLIQAIVGKGASACGGCSCTGSNDAQQPRLGKRKELVQLGVDGESRKSGAS